MDPLVSVITPAFNAARTLRRAHDSLARQAGRWQHVIVDDGSTDDTPRIVAEISRDPRVLPIRTANRGQSAALNTGITAASGEFVAFLDADDEYLPDHVTSHLEAFSRQPEIDVLWGGAEVICLRDEDRMMPDVAAGFGLICIEDCVLQGTIFGHRRVFDAVRFTEDRGVWWQDFDLIRRASQSFKVGRFSQVTYRYYRDSGCSIVDRAKAAWPVAPTEPCEPQPRE